jgi:hypothetical protein
MNLTPTSTNVNMPGNGMVRFNMNSQLVEFYDGYVWQSIPTEEISLDLNQSTKDAVEWCLARMNEEKKLEQLAETNPTIKDLLGQKKSLDEKLKMVEILTRGNTVGAS